MNKSIYIAQNNKDTFDFNIPAFDTGAISAAINTPVSNEVVSKDETPENSGVFLGFIFIIFIVCVVLAFCFRKKKPEEEKQYYSSKRKERREYVREVPQEHIVEEPKDKTTLYRHSSNKKTSLSTPTSINKCIRAFLENTKEN